MMNICVCINLLLSAFVSVCLAASLTDDQLAQILGEKLQTDTLTDSREYPSIDDIKEFERRIAALDKLDEVTEQLFPENSPEEYGDGSNTVSSAKTDINAAMETDISKNTEYANDITESTNTGRELDRSILKEINLDETDNVANIYYDCLRDSKTQEELTECFNIYHFQTNTNEYNELKEKRNPFCGRYGCFKKRNLAVNNVDDSANIDSSCTENSKTFEDIITCIENKKLHNSDHKIEEKRNPFCGRFGCGRKRSVNIKYDSTGDSADENKDCVHVSTTLEEVIKCFKNGQLSGNDGNAFYKTNEKRNPFCGRYGCGRKRADKRVFCNRYGCARSLRKAWTAAELISLRDNMSQDSNNPFNKLIRRHPLERKAKQNYFNSRSQSVFRQKSDRRTTPFTKKEKRKSRSSANIKFPDQIENIIKRKLGGLCGGGVGGYNRCIVRPKKVKIKIKKVKIEEK